MKRSFRMACALFLVLGLCSLLVTVSATTDPDALRITSIDVSQDGENTVLQMTFQNNGNAAIDEFGLALAFYGEDGSQIFGYDDTLEGYYDEVCNWYYTPSDPIPAGDNYWTEDVFAEYAGTTEISVAIRYYHPVSGDYILIPESEWEWLWPGDVSTSDETGRSYYSPPSDALYEKIDALYQAYSSYLLDDFNASYYHKTQGGAWLTWIEADSALEQAGLAVGDLVIFAGGVKLTENLFAIDYAMDTIMNGESVEWVYERDGLLYTTTVSNP